MIYAEDLNYWRTGQSTPDAWLERAKRELNRVGGRIKAEGFMSESGGYSAFMLAFEMDDERFKILWPVLKSKSGNVTAAKIQAATMLYHDIKARCVKVKVFGARVSFLDFYCLPDGRTMAQAAAAESFQMLPEIFRPLLSSGEIVDG